MVFELGRFELVGGQRCEVEGRWLGIRGRRFMRPALNVVVDGQETRLLADLAHKPWAAEDGESWIAAFPYSLSSQDIAEAELTVAPDITIALPAPQGRAARRQAAGHSKGQMSAAKTPGPELRAPAPEREIASDDSRRLRQQLDRLEAEKARAAARMDELLGNLSQATGERDAAKAARDELAAERDAVRRELGEARDEVDAARRARDELAAERDAARRERQEALAAAEAAVEARERALAERGAALAAQNQARSEREAAVASRDQASAERDAALSLRDHALAERDTALARREDAVSELDTLSRMNARLQSQLTHHLSSQGAAMVMRRAAQEGPVSRPYHQLLSGAAVTIVILALLVALLIIVRVV